MFRKISVAILTFVLSAAAVFAQSSDPDKGGVVVSKTAKNNYNGTYTINIEAFVTGKQVTTTGIVSQPVDAVLVLDVSGSMTEPVDKMGIKVATYKEKNGKIKTATAADHAKVSLSDGQNLYIRSDNDYYLLQYGGYSGYFYLNSQQVSGTETIYIGGKTRLQALQESVKQFVATMKQMQDQYNYETRVDPEPLIQHRVSIVTFSSEKYDGQNKLVLSLEAGKLDIEKGASTLVKSINSTIDRLYANGATEADKGMLLGYNEMDSNKRNDASKLMVFFTDGYPTSSNSFEESVANRAINYGFMVKNTLKASIYVVSVIDPYESDPKKFMNYLSSNYPNAKSLTQPGNDGQMGGKYFMIAPDEAALKQAFVGIAKDFTSGGAAIELNSETITADIVMSDFQISKKSGNFNADDIDVYIRPFNGIDNKDNYLWGDKETNSNLETVVEDDQTTGNHIVKVKGFAFGEHWCGYDYVNGNKGDVHPGGQKLCLDIQLVPNLDKSGGMVATNDPISGLYLEKAGEEGLGTQLASFGASPVVYAPCDIIVEREGLKPGESVIYQMTRNRADGQSDPDYEPVTVVVTADDSGIARTVVKGDATYLDDPDDEDSVQFYTYTVTEVPATANGQWDWTYEHKSGAFLTQTHALYTEGQLDNEFIFSDPGRKELDENTYDEAAKKNVFKKLNKN